PVIPSPPGPSTFPYTTLFRSQPAGPDRSEERSAWRLPRDSSIPESRGICQGSAERATNPDKTRFGRAQRFSRTRLLASGFFIREDRKSTRLNSSHVSISYAVF